MKKNSNIKKKIIIVGGGVSGLSAGIFALQNGFEVELFEKNPQPGGLCAAWKRRGYEIDGCIHWLTGTKPGCDLYNIWRTLGVITEEDNVIYQEDAGKFYYKGGTLTLYCDVNKLEEELLRVAPEDKKIIKKLMKDVRLSYKFPVPLSEPINTMNIFKLTKLGCSFLPYLRFFLWAKKETCTRAANRFKSEMIRYIITAFQPGPGSYYPAVFSLSTVIYRNGGIPRGGSKAMVDNMVNKFLSLGGTLRLSTPVKEIVIEDKICRGVILENDERVNANYVVSALDAHYLLNVLLKGQIRDKKFEKRFNNYHRYPSPSCFVCYYRINKNKLETISDSHQNFFQVEPFKVSQRQIYAIKMRDYRYDPYFDKGDDTIVEVLLEQYNKDYDFWVNLYQDKEKYNAEKQRIADIVKDRILKQFPTLQENDLELIDSFSPCTLTRYTNTYMGSFMSFMMTKYSSVIFHRGYFKGAKNLYFASQWEQTPGGLPLAASAGMFAIQRILKKEKRNHNILKKYQ